MSKLEVRTKMSRETPKSETPHRQDQRLVMGRSRRREAQFPVAPPAIDLPTDYAAALVKIKRRIQQERLRVVLSANSAMVVLYWDIGRFILNRQRRSGWGARLVDRMAHDLQKAFPDMKGFSPRNLLFMRAFAEAYTDAAIVKQFVSQIPWGHIVRLIQTVKEPSAREWYVRKTIEHGWSRSILELQIDGRAHERSGKALTNFKEVLPSVNSDTARQVFKDPYLFDFLGTADPRREREMEQALDRSLPKLPDRTRKRICLRGQTSSAGGRRPGFPRRFTFLPSQAPLFRRDRTESCSIRPLFCRQVKLLLVCRRRPHAPTRRQSHHRAAAVQVKKQGGSRVRLTPPRTPHRRRPLGNTDRQVASKGIQRESSCRRRSRKGTRWQRLSGFLVTWVQYCGYIRRSRQIRGSTLESDMTVKGTTPIERPSSVSSSTRHWPGL